MVQEVFFFNSRDDKKFQEEVDQDLFSDSFFC